MPIDEELVSMMTAATATATAEGRRKMMADALHARFRELSPMPAGISRRRHLSERILVLAAAITILMPRAGGD